MKAPFTDCSVLRTKRPFLLSQTTTIAIVGWWHWLHQGSLATVITEPRGVVQVVKTYFPYRFRADAGELVRTAGVLVRYQLGRVVPGHVGSRPSATHLGKGTEHQHRRRKWHTNTQREQCRDGEKGVKVNLIIQIYSIYLPFGTQSFMGVERKMRKMGPSVKTLGHFRFGWAGNWLTLHWSKTLVPCTVWCSTPDKLIFVGLTAKKTTTTT